MHKKIKDFETWLNKPSKPLNDIEFKKLAISYLRYLKDKDNNPLFESDYYRPVNNNHKLYVLGCVPVNMQTQPYQPTVVRRSK